MIIEVQSQDRSQLSFVSDIGLRYGVVQILVVQMCPRTIYYDTFRTRAYPVHRAALNSAGKPVEINFNSAKGIECTACLGAIHK